MRGRSESSRFFRFSSSNAQYQLDRLPRSSPIVSFSSISFSLFGLPKQNLAASRTLVHAHGLLGVDLLAKVLSQARSNPYR